MKSEHVEKVHSNAAVADEEVSIQGKILANLMGHITNDLAIGKKIKSGELRKRMKEPAWLVPDCFVTEDIDTVSYTHLELIVNHLSDFGREASYYDRIVTGDLGSVGQKILIDLCRQKGVDISKNHEDCGMKMFDATNQNTGSGGSGCACSATVLSAYYLPKLRSGELKRILFVPTGALLSPVSFNEGESVPGIAHGVVLEAAI